MKKRIAKNIEGIAIEISRLLQEEDPHTIVVITDSKIRIIRDEYGFVVKKAANIVDHQFRV